MKTSRGAAKEFSPGRQPWDNAASTIQPRSGEREFFVETLLSPLRG